MFFNLYVLLFCTLIVHIRYSKKLKFSSNFKFSTMIEEFIKSEEKKKNSSTISRHKALQIFMNIPG